MQCAQFATYGTVQYRAPNLCSMLISLIWRGYHRREYEKAREIEIKTDLNFCLNFVQVSSWHQTERLPRYYEYYSRLELTEVPETV